AWFEGLPESARRTVWNYVDHPDQRTSEVAWQMIRLAWSSKAGLAIAPLQDLLNLGVEGRMNLPGTAEGNWRWRATDERLVPSVFDGLRDLTSASGRSKLANAHQTEAVEAWP